MSDTVRESIIEAFSNCIELNDKLRKHPHAYRSSPPNLETPEGREYQTLSTAYRAAEAVLWMKTDVEYDEDGFRNVVWEWRHAKVMARKCCWMQRFGATGDAAKAMRQLQEAESALATVCGRGHIYRTSCSYLEEAFPNLKHA